MSVLNYLPIYGNFFKNWQNNKKILKIILNEGGGGEGNVL